MVIDFRDNSIICFLKKIDKIDLLISFSFLWQFIDH